MELKPGLSALVTGAASGIGKALCLALGSKGVFVTVIDFSDRGREVADLVEKENAKFHPDLKFPSSIFVRCDVTDSEALSVAFKKHLETYGGLDICINNAGITNPIPFSKDQTDGSTSWRRTIDVNLIAAIDCTRLAIQSMEAVRKPGVIINMGSASGLYPAAYDPIYSGSKGGLVMFTRSLLLYKRRGIRVNVLCPEFIETELSKVVDPETIHFLGGYLPMETIVKGAFELISDETKAGACLWITNRRGVEYWPTPSEEAKYRLPFSRLRKESESSSVSHLNTKIPQSFSKM